MLILRLCVQRNVQLQNNAHINFDELSKRMQRYARIKLVPASLHMYDIMINLKCQGVMNAFVWELDASGFWKQSYSDSYNNVIIMYSTTDTISVLPVSTISAIAHTLKPFFIQIPRSSCGWECHDMSNQETSGVGITSC